MRSGQPRKAKHTTPHTEQVCMCPSDSQPPRRFALRPKKRVHRWKQALLLSDSSLLGLDTDRGLERCLSRQQEERGAVLLKHKLADHGKDDMSVCTCVCVCVCVCVKRMGYHQQKCISASLSLTTIF